MLWVVTETYLVGPTEDWLCNLIITWILKLAAAPVMRLTFTSRYTTVTQHPLNSVGHQRAMSLNVPFGPHRKPWANSSTGAIEPGNHSQLGIRHPGARYGRLVLHVGLNRTGAGAPT